MTYFTSFPPEFFNLYVPRQFKTDTTELKKEIDNKMKQSEIKVEIRDLNDKYPNATRVYEECSDNRDTKMDV